MVISEITSNIIAALGENVEGNKAPFDASTTSTEKIRLRVRSAGWSITESFMDSGNPAVGTEQIEVSVRVWWQHWDYDSIRPENRKVIRVLEGMGWQLENVAYDEDADYLDTNLTFSQTQVAPY